MLGKKSKCYSWRDRKKAGHFGILGRDEKSAAVIKEKRGSAA